MSSRPPSESRIPQLNCGNIVSAVTSRIPFPGSKLLQSRSIPRPTFSKLQPNQENPPSSNDTGKANVVQNPIFINDDVKEPSRIPSKSFDVTTAIDQDSIRSWKLPQASGSSASVIKKQSLLKLPTQAYSSNKKNECLDFGNVRLKISKFNAEFQISNTQNVVNNECVVNNDSNKIYTTQKNESVIFNPDLHSTIIGKNKSEENISISESLEQSDISVNKTFTLSDDSSKTIVNESDESLKFSVLDNSACANETGCKYNNIKCSDKDVHKEIVLGETFNINSYNKLCRTLDANNDEVLQNNPEVSSHKLRRRTFTITTEETRVSDKNCDPLLVSETRNSSNIRTENKFSDIINNYEDTNKLCSKNYFKNNEQSVSTTPDILCNRKRVFTKTTETCLNEDVGGLDTNKYNEQIVNDHIPALPTSNKSVESTLFKQPFSERSFEEVQLIGQRVKVCSSEYGVLRYVGSVHFKSDYDVWCGVELENPAGKHDGKVKGVRYFTCKDNHGILAPIAKVEFLKKSKSNIENLKSKFESKNIKSPSHSAKRKSATTEKKIAYTENNIFNCELENTYLENESGPFSIIDIDYSLDDETKNILDQTKLISKPDTAKVETSKNLKRIKNDSIREENNSKRRLTEPASTNENAINWDCTSNDTGIQQDQLNFSPKSQLYDVGPTFSVPTSLQLTKQNSFELDESLGILTPDQMCEFPETPSNDDLSSLLLDSKQSDKTISNNSSNNSRTPSSENLGSLPRNSVQVLSSTNESVENDGIGDHLNVDFLSDTKMNLEYPDSESYENFISKPFKQSNDLTELISPNVADSYAGDLSLGLLDDEVLVSTELLSERTSSNLDTTINMDLPLDPIDGTAKTLKQILRCEQTPSPEELPLDPIGLGSAGGSTNVLSLNPNTDSDPDVKTDATKSTTKTSSSFITSITSITSLDNGYQGDGEMSRPASRGGDHSPTVHKPSNQGLVAAINNQWQRAVSRRPDPMTDSDFFTESDADGHDENRRVVQIIDGQLYGMNAPNMQAAGEEIFVNNPNQVAEEMESSGIFTDLETNTRADDLSDADRHRNEENKVADAMDEDRSPSDISSKTISENSQERNEADELDNTLVKLSDTIIKNENVEIKETTRENSRNSSISRGSVSENSTQSGVSKSAKKLKDDPSKKYRMPNRNVVSKIKSMLEAKQNSNNLENQENRKPSQKKNGNRWNAVMNKISDNKTKPNLKEVKSKVASHIVGSGNSSGTNTKTVLGQSATNSYKTGTVLQKPKSRRTRTRAYETVSKSGTGVCKQASGSLHSSLSDISNSGSTLPSLASKSPAFKTPLNRASKKRDTSATVTRCTSPSNEGTGRSQQLLGPQWQARTPRNVTTVKKTPSTIRSIDCSYNQSNVTPIEIKSTTTTASTRRTPSRRLFNGNAGAKNAVTHPAHTKDPNRVTGAPVAKSANGRPTTQQQLQQPQVPATVPATVPLASQVAPHLKHASLGVEALGVLVQHLVFNYDAFKTPYLKKDLENLRTDWVQTKLSLEEMKMGYRRLEDMLNDEKVKAESNLDEERRRYRAEIADIFEKHRASNLEIQNKFMQEKNEIERQFEIQLSELKLKQENGLKEILIENEQLKSECNKLNEETGRYKSEMEYLVSDCEKKEKELTTKLEKSYVLYNELKLKCDTREKELLNKLSIAEKVATAAEEESRKVIESFKVETKDSKLQAALNRCTQLQDEAESLRTVLELKQDELSELRRAHEEAKEATDLLAASQIKAQALQARVEDLELQLERKTNLEKQLDQEKKILMESYQQESKHKNRLSLHNEELQWKLKQNSEMINALLTRVSFDGSNQSLTDESPSRSPRTPLMRSTLQSASFSEKHSYSSPLERNSSLRERYSSSKNNVRIEKKSFSENKSVSPGSKTSELYSSSCFEIEDISPPSSPKIKAVVEKSDSVSYVLEIDESPEVLANRMYRRSFRNSTPPKSTPTKSPAPKRQKCKTNHPLSLSASATMIGSGNYVNDKRSRSKSVSIKTGRNSNGQGDLMSVSWNPDISSSNTSNNRILDFRQEIRRVELGPSEVELDSLSGDIIIDSDIKHDDIDDGDVDFAEHIHMSLPALPSELNRSQKEDKKQDLIQTLPSSGDLRLLQPLFPKNSAGEAMISESNSEDECSTSASSDRSHCLSDSEDLAKTAAAICQKTSKMQYELMVMTGSTNSETMDYSWSEEMDLMQELEN